MRFGCVTTRGRRVTIGYGDRVEDEMREAVIERLEKALAGGFPLIYARCDEEARLVSFLAPLAARHCDRNDALVEWSVTRGFVCRGQVLEAERDPLAALDYVVTHGAGRFFLFKDLPLLFDSRAELVRGLRDLYDALLDSDCHVFLSSTLVTLPDALAHQVFMVELGSPDEAELQQTVLRLGAELGVSERLSDDWVSQVVPSLKGLTLGETGHLMRRLVAEDRLELDVALSEIHEEKAAALMREACLKFYPGSIDIDQVGGLENLKQWVTSRRAFFTRAGLTSGVPLPAGVLFMGVSGCGKSMAAKVIAGAWKLPLVRLDMNLVLSGAYGSPEYAFDHALRVAEHMAPLVLWIDEMENSFGYDTDTRGGNNPNIFSSFLTWMQEKPAGVFVVATANRIEKLPAEVIRKGRFDQLFFLDLPTDEERKRILEIHLKRVGVAPTGFDLGALSAVTRAWSGAEIEQAVRAAVVKAWETGAAVTDRDVMWAASRMVPLSRTMEEQIKRLRAWSQERATPASAKPAS